MRKTGENGRKNNQRMSGNESSRGKLGDIFEKEGHDDEEKREKEEGGQDERKEKKTVMEELGGGEG